MSRALAIVAEFESPAAIYHAAGKVTEAGYTKTDAHTPFPVHGLDKKLAQGPSHLGWFVICGGFAGIILAQLLMWWTNGIDYPFWVAGKEPYAWQATIPITFELMVLLSGLTAVFGMFAINKIPRLHNPIFEHSTFHRVTDDRFFLSVDSADPKFDSLKTVSFLESLGGQHVELLSEDEPKAKSAKAKKS